jgi:uncharacterized protein YecE (DUF72 family)
LTIGSPSTTVLPTVTLTTSTGDDSSSSRFATAPAGEAHRLAAEADGVAGPQTRAAERRLWPVHIGCSGWNYRSWRPELYPQGLAASRWLERYSERFDTVEVNSTFYRLASRAAVKHWLEQTPQRFVFAVKASRYLTHVKRLSDLGTGIEHFYERIEPLVAARRLGPVLWQLPENFRRDDERLQAALDSLPAGRHAFEFRHPSWFTAPVYALLQDHRVALVLGDHPARPFQTDHATTQWRYIRLHYGSRGRRGNYSARELSAWSERLHAWRHGGELFVYFNNDWEAFAPRNALALARAVEELARRTAR